MDFGAVPPEVNSAKMYSGPGAGSMLVAAAAWEEVADELYATARSCEVVVSALTSEAWQSPAAMAMTAAVAPYVAWLSATAGQAQQAAAQLGAAAAAFDTAFAATAPPPVIAANRATLLLLVATNVLGVNTPAIAVVEADYGEMWAQDAAAMYGYAAEAAAAATLTAFTLPDAVADPAGIAQQALAITQVVPSVLQQLASPVSACASTMSSSLSSLSSMSSVAKSLGTATAAAETGVAGGVAGGLAAGEIAGIALPAGLFAGLGSAPPSVTAALGKAASLGPLSVPHAWTSSAVASRAAAEAAPAGVAPLVAGEGNLLSGLPIAGMAPRGEGVVSTSTQRVGVRPTVMPRPELIG